MQTNKVARKLVCFPVGAIVALALVLTVSTTIAQTPPQVPSTGRHAGIFKLSKIDRQSDLNSPLESIQNEPIKGGGRIDEEPLSEDCIAKRNEALRLKQQSFQPDGKESGSNVRNLAGNEYVPQCRLDGKFEPVQCNKPIDSCWCVNKFGQPIRGSAFDSKKPLSCEPSMFEGIGGNKPGSLLSESNTSAEIGNERFEPVDGTGIMQVRLDSSAHKDFKTEEPNLNLVPNECEISRKQAIERASRSSDSSIWIPECDASNGKLYAARQCHSSKICWCVDQSRGLPLLSGQPLVAQPSLDCSQLRQSIELAGGTNWRARVPFGFGQTCDIQRRAHFMRLIMDQFRMQIGEYMSGHPNRTKPAGLTWTQPQELPDSQVLLWMFTLLDANGNGRLEDREWCKFKMNFKLVDRLGETGRPQVGASWSPLSILRSERLCWRDLLELCAGGRLLVRDSIDLARWAACMGPGGVGGEGAERGQEAWASDRSQASTREAAITRSRTKNPFAGILKSD